MSAVGEWQERRQEERHREQMMAVVIAGMMRDYTASLLLANPRMQDDMIRLAGQIVARIGWND